MNFSIIFKKNFFGWKKYIFKNYEVWFSGYVYERHKFEFVNLIINCIHKQDLKKKIISIKKKYNGHYSLLIKKKNFLLIITDNICSIPIFYKLQNQEFFFSNCPDILLKKKFKTILSNDQCNFLLNSGYTIGKNTIYKNFYYLAANEIFIFKNKKQKILSQFPLYCRKKIKLDKKKLINLLKLITFSIFKDLIKSAEGRQLVIPLSSGYDSRLILSFVNELKYKNIICYSYGISNNSESQIAKKICKKLNIKFIFDELRIEDERKFYQSNIFKKFLNYADVKHSIPMFQGLSTLLRLKNKNLLDKNAIILNGNSGDFISGGHLSGFIKEKNKNNTSVYDYIVQKHFSQWETEKLKFKNQIIKQLVTEREIYDYSLKKKITDYEFYEIFEYVNRQEKYVSSNRVNEFCGYEWRMPLWDQRFVNFWTYVDKKYKIDQNLYIDFLKKLNLGKVWDNDIPVNQKKVFPIYIRYFRNFLKIFFLFFEKKKRNLAWYKFDKIYLYYFYETTRMMCSFKYTDYTNNKNLGKNSFHTSLQSLEYIKKLNFKKKNFQNFLYD